MDDVPPTQYAKSGDCHIAYQVLGHGPLDVVFIPGFVSHVEHAWDDPRLAHFYRHIASFARLILFDKRGTGMSDPVPIQQLPTLEQRMDDVRAVMDAVGSERAALIGVSEGGPLNLLFAATYPDGTAAIVLINTFARIAWAPDYPCGTRPDVWGVLLERMEQGWGKGVLLSAFAQSLAGDAAAREWWARFQRQAASPGAAVALMRMTYDIDTRPILPAIRVPTLILHRAEDRMVPVEHAHYLARQIPDSKYVELPGKDHFFFTGDADAFLAQIEEFLTGERHAIDSERVLATVLFVDIVGSTERAAQLGDRRWHELLDKFYSVARRQLERFRAARSTPQATASLPPLTGRHARFDVPQPSAAGFARSAWKFAPACTPASARSWGRRLVGSRCTSARAWRATQDRMKSSSQGPSRISSQDPASPSMPEASMH